MTATAALLLAGLSVVSVPFRDVTPQDPSTRTGGAKLVQPPVLENQSSAAGTVEVTLTAQARQRELVDGLETDVFAYNGRIPGPTLEVREGDRVIIHLRNELPEETTVHWHGLHIPWTADGSPFHPIPPGGQADFEFTIPEGTAGTYWYHPHPHHHTRSQVAKGLYGALLVRPARDPLADIPEKVLILADNRLLADGSVDLPDRESAQGRIDFENGREGDILFVNGQVMPEVAIRAGEVQRWRVINASAARVYRLSIPGQRLLHVGSDGGLFERPVEVDDILIANSERVEFLVRGTGAPGSLAVLQDLPYDRYIPQTRPRSWNTSRNLLTLRYDDTPVVQSIPVPERLVRIEPIDTAEASTTRVMVLTQGFINNKTMDMARVDETTSLGSTEIWQIENLVGMDHPFHLHGFRFQVLDRDGVPEPFRQWKDTVNVPKHSVVRFIVRFDDYAGKWMFHCHILDHEEHGMMGILEVK